MSSARKAVTASVVVALLLGLALAGWVYSRRGTEIHAQFSSSVGLYPGSDVQVLGVSVGKVSAVEPDDGVVRVTMKLDPGTQVSADTDAVIVAPTLVSDRFVQLTKPYTTGGKLRAGATIQRDHTAVPVEIDDLYRSLTDVSDKLGPNGANKKGSLSELLDVAAANLDGQGKGINTTIGELSKATGTLAGSDDDLFATIGNLKQFNDMLVANDQNVAEVNRQFASVTKYLSDDREDLGSAISNLGDALSILDDFIADNRGHLKSSVDNLIGPTQVLVKQKAALEESVRLAPLVLQNFLRAYNAGSNTIDGRGNLNEATIWAKNGLGARTSSDAPPTLLPGMGDR